METVRSWPEVPCELVGQMVSTRLYPGGVVVVADDAVVARHERLSDPGGIRYDWQHYIPQVQRLRRGLLRQRRGDRVMAQVLAIVATAGLDAVIVAVELAMANSPPSGLVSVEHVVNVIGRLNAPSAPLVHEVGVQAVCHRDAGDGGLWLGALSENLCLESSAMTTSRGDFGVFQGVHLTWIGGHNPCRYVGHIRGDTSN